MSEDFVRIRVALMAPDTPQEFADAVNEVGRIMAENERLREQIEAERAVLTGKWMLDADHARQAMLALERLPYVEEDAARLREALDDLLAEYLTHMQENAYTEQARAAIDAARTKKEAGA
jgi:hypothetical protein